MRGREAFRPMQIDLGDMESKKKNRYAVREERLSRRAGERGRHQIAKKKNRKFQEEAQQDWSIPHQQRLVSQYFESTFWKSKKNNSNSDQRLGEYRSWKSHSGWQRWPVACACYNSRACPSCSVCTGSRSSTCAPILDMCPRRTDLTVVCVHGDWKPLARSLFGFDGPLRGL